MSGGSFTVMFLLGNQAGSQLSGPDNHRGDCSLGSLSPQANPYPMLSAFFSLLSSILPLLKRTQSLIILGVFASLLTFLHDVLVPQESMEVGVVCVRVCVYIHTRIRMVGIKPKLNSFTVFYQIDLLCTPQHCLI